MFMCSKASRTIVCRKSKLDLMCVVPFYLHVLPEYDPSAPALSRVLRTHGCDGCSRGRKKQQRTGKLVYVRTNTSSANRKKKQKVMRQNQFVCFVLCVSDGHCVEVIEGEGQEVRRKRKVLENRTEKHMLLLPRLLFVFWFVCFRVF